MATINGTSRGQMLKGTEGADRIYAKGGNDIVHGNGGNDRVWGDEGQDRVSGGAGNDVVGGGIGDDSLWGGQGADTFAYSDGRDIIMDFNSSQDELQLSGWSFRSLDSNRDGYIDVSDSRVYEQSNGITIELGGSDSWSDYLCLENVYYLGDWNFA